jgi:hypothetical protein
MQISVPFFQSYMTIAGVYSEDWTGKMYRTRGPLAVLLIATVYMVVTLFWPDGEVHVIDAASGRIVFCEDVTADTHALGHAWIDSGLSETVASPGADIVTGLGRNTFTVTCTNRNHSLFAPLRASFTLIVRDARGQTVQRLRCPGSSRYKGPNCLFRRREGRRGRILDLCDKH